MLYEILKPIVRGIALIMWRLDARGAEQMPRTGPLLLVSNHISVLDPPLIGCVTPRPLTYLAKAELFDVPLLGRLIRALNARPVRREGSDARALKDALRVLEEGRALLVFPEGTRGTEGVLREAKPGAGMLAVLSGAVVVPVYIAGSGRAMPRGATFPRPGTVRIRFGPPLHFKPGSGPERKETYRAAAVEMTRAIAQLQAQAA